MINRYRLTSTVYDRENESQKVLPEKRIFYLLREMTQRKNTLMVYQKTEKPSG